MRLYRFETEFQGEPQDVGFFQAMYDAGLPEGVPERLEGMFAGLVPAIQQIDEPAKFWFTEAGLARFAKEIAAVASVLEQYGWTLTLAAIDDSQAGGRVLYRDGWQVGIAVDPSGPPEHVYRPVRAGQVLGLAGQNPSSM